MKKDVDNSAIKYQIVQEENLSQIIENFIKL